MNKDDNKSIYEFDFNLICEYFSTLERQGPGAPEITLKALSFIDNLTEQSLIVDLGCGSGRQTLILGQHVPCRIIAIDLFSNFIKKLNENVQRLDLQNRISGQVGSMDNLSFGEEELDVIWSEGAIYNIGFERGINEWRKYLKKGGYVAVTEASWFTETRPKEIEEFWMNAYPEIDTISNKVAQMQKAGYLPIATFVLPEYCWTTNFYHLQKDAQRKFLEKYPDNMTAQKFVKYQRNEEELYNKYKQFYGYVFYIGKKIRK